MDIGEVDKDTIIESSSESEDRRIKSKKEKKTKKRSRSREKENKKKKRINSTDSRSSSGHKRERRSDRPEKYDKYKDKNKKDKEEKYERQDREEDRKYKKRSRSRSRHRSRRHSRSRSPYQRDRKKNKRRNRSKSSDVEVKTVQTHDRSISNVEIKKKFDDFSKTTNSNAPISTSDPSKRDRELYVANLPEGLSPTNVTDLINAAMVAICANVKSGNPVVSCWISSDSNYAFLEFRTPEEAHNAFKLDNISLMGKEIKIGRPRYQDEVEQVTEIVSSSKDMFPTLTSFEKDLSNPFINRTSSSNTTTSVAKQTPAATPSNMPAQSKLLVSNLPLNFTEDSVYKFLRTFGKIKSLEMIKDPITGQYSGQCHVEYETEAATANALHYAMGINLQGNILYLKRSSGLVPVYSISSGGNSSLGILTNGMNMSLGGPGSYSSNPSYITADDYMKLRETTLSKVICIKNMCTYKELEDDDEYDDLYDDVMEECKNYAKVISVKIPRPEIGENVQGIGKVFVEYFTRDGAAFAKEHLNGKSFHGRTVEVVYHPEDMFRKNQLD